MVVRILLVLALITAVGLSVLVSTRAGAITSSWDLRDLPASWDLPEGACGTEPEQLTCIDMLSPARLEELAAQENSQPIPDPDFIPNDNEALQQAYKDGGGGTLGSPAGGKNRGE